MKNPKTSQPARIGSVDLKKAVSVIKCFICNQMFYSQNTFDDHMKLHSSKLSRNVPEQIQRKTMQSFRVKKNTSISGNKQSISGVTGKRMLNQTASLIRPKVQETMFIDSQKDKQEEQDSKNQIKQAQQLLRQSTILIQKLEVMAKQKPQLKSQSPAKNQNLEYSPTSSQSEQEFLSKCLLQFENFCKNAQKQVLNTRFQNQYLQSCQQQLQYMNQLLMYLEVDELNQKKYSKMKKDIIQAIIDFVRENATVNQEKEEKLSNQRKGEGEAQIFQVEIAENEELSHCNECFIEIQYGSQCWQEKNYHANTENRIKYHIECWEEIQKQKETKNKNK